MLLFHFMFPFISLPAFIGPVWGKYLASFKFSIICFVFVLKPFLFSKTAILRNILFMCIGGWIYTLKRQTIEAKKKSERDNQSH